VPGENEIEIVLRAQNLFSAELQKLVSELRMLVPTSDAVSQKFTQLYAAIERVGQQQQKTAAGFADFGQQLGSGIGSAIQGFQQLSAAAMQAERQVALATQQSAAAEASLRKQIEDRGSASAAPEPTPDDASAAARQATAPLEAQLAQLEDVGEKAQTAGDILTAAWASRTRAVQAGLANEVQAWDKLLPSVTAATEARAKDAQQASQQALAAEKVVGAQAKAQGDAARANSAAYRELNQQLRSGTVDTARYADLINQMPEGLNRTAQATWALGRANAEQRKSTEAYARSLQQTVVAVEAQRKVLAQGQVGGDTGAQMALPGVSRYMPGTEETGQLGLPGINAAKIKNDAVLQLAANMSKVQDAAKQPGLSQFNDSLLMMLPRITSLMPGLNAFTSLILQIQNVKSIGSMLAAALGGGAAAAEGEAVGAGATKAATALAGLVKVAVPVAAAIGYMIVAMRQMAARQEASVQSTVALNSAIAGMDVGAIRQYGASAAHALDIIEERTNRGILSFSRWRQIAENTFTAMTEGASPAQFEIAKLAKAAEAYNQIFPQIQERNAAQAAERMANMQAQEARYGLYSARSVEHLIVLQNQLTDAYQTAHEARLKTLASDRDIQIRVARQESGVEHLLKQRELLEGQRGPAAAGVPGFPSVEAIEKGLAEVSVALTKYDNQVLEANENFNRQVAISVQEQRVSTERRARQFMSMLKSLEAEPIRIDIEKWKLQMQMLQGDLQLLQIKLAETADTAVGGVLEKIRGTIAQSGALQLKIAYKTEELELAKIPEPLPLERLKEIFKYGKTGGVTEEQWGRIQVDWEMEMKGIAKVRAATEALGKVRVQAVEHQINVEKKLNEERAKQELEGRGVLTLQERAKEAAAVRDVAAAEEQLARIRLQQDITPDNWERYSAAAMKAADNVYVASQKAIEAETAAAVAAQKHETTKSSARAEGDRKLEDLARKRQLQNQQDLTQNAQIASQMKQITMQRVLDETQAAQQIASARAQLARAQLQMAAPSNWQAVTQQIRAADLAEDARTR
jgi:hypothetical protein